MPAQGRHDGLMPVQHTLRHPGLEPGSRFFFFSTAAEAAGLRIKSGVTTIGISVQ
jgi:hypothetical protein